MSHRIDLSVERNSLQFCLPRTLILPAYILFYKATGVDVTKLDVTTQQVRRGLLKRRFVNGIRLNCSADETLNKKCLIDTDAHTTELHPEGPE